MKFTLLLLISFLLAGCSTPFGRLSSAGTVIDSNERLVIQSQSTKDGRRLTCSEPPPDTSASVFKAISASLSGNVQEKAEGQAALNSISNSEVVKLFSRSQGIQGLRDGMYRSCEAYINGGIDEATYGQQMTYMTATLNFLVTIELCGKILDSDKLINSEASQAGDKAVDLRASLYEGCIDTARQFAGAILGANNDFNRRNDLRNLEERMNYR